MFVSLGPNGENTEEAEVRYFFFFFLQILQRLYNYVI